VVLAATLYAVLGGFGGLIGKPTPTASMTVSITGTSNYSVTFTSVSSNLSLANTQLKIADGTGTHVYSYSTNDYSASGINVNVTGGGYLTYNTVINIRDTSSINAIYIIDTQTGGVVASQTNI
jgi:FlaG/FlaF family flagellin (archaellin)